MALYQGTQGDTIYCLAVQNCPYIFPVSSLLFGYQWTSADLVPCDSARRLWRDYFPEVRLTLLARRKFA
jgi:hypothetical protein